MFIDYADFLYPSMGTNAATTLFGTPVKAGFPSPAEDYIEDHLDLNEHLIQHHNATFFKPLVDEWVLYDNSSSEPILVSEGVNS